MNKNKIALGIDDFNKGINKGIFTNIEKGMSPKQFKQSYPDAQFDVFEKGIVENYIKDVYKKTGGEIIKGGFNDTPKVAKSLALMKAQVKSLHNVKVEFAEGIKDFYVMLKSKDVQGDKKDTLQKGIIADNLHYGGSKNSIEFEKTGKEIKDKVSTVKVLEQAKILDLEKRMSEMQSEFKNLPTETPYKYGTAKGISCPYKTFNWNLTYFEPGQSSNMSYENADGSYTNVVASQESADFHREWNRCVEEWMDCHTEIKAIELYENNLEDNKKYKLSATQMLFFNF